MTCSYAELAGPISLAVVVGAAVGLAAARAWKRPTQIVIGPPLDPVAPPPLAGRGPELVRLGRANQGVPPEDRS